MLPLLLLLLLLPTHDSIIIRAQLICSSKSISASTAHHSAQRALVADPAHPATSIRVQTREPRTQHRNPEANLLRRSPCILPYSRPTSTSSSIDLTPPIFYRYAVLSHCHRLATLTLV
jgi:hypothetical protein